MTDPFRYLRDDPLGCDLSFGLHLQDLRGASQNHSKSQTGVRVLIKPFKK